MDVVCTGWERGSGKYFNIYFYINFYMQYHLNVPGSHCGDLQTYTTTLITSKGMTANVQAVENKTAA